VKPSSIVTLGVVAIKWPKTWLLTIATATELGRPEVRTDEVSLLPADNDTVSQSLADSELFRKPDMTMRLPSSNEDGPASRVNSVYAPHETCTPNWQTSSRAKSVRSRLEWTRT